jgi:hypothetical protein
MPAKSHNPPFSRRKMMRLLIGSAFLMVVLSGCSDGGDPTINAAKPQIAAQFRDPDAVKFKDLKIKGTEPHRYICGSANGKNGFGAYVGFTRFTADIAGTGKEVSVTWVETEAEAAKRVQDAPGERGRQIMGSIVAERLACK